MTSKRISRKAGTPAGDNDIIFGDDLGFEIDDFQDDYLGQLKSARNFPSSPNYQPSRSNKGMRHRHSNPNNNPTSTSSATTAAAVVAGGQASKDQRSPRMDDGLTSDEDFDRKYDLSPLDVRVKMGDQQAIYDRAREKNKMISPPHGAVGGSTSRRLVDPWDSTPAGGFPIRYVPFLLFA